MSAEKTTSPPRELAPLDLAPTAGALALFAGALRLATAGTLGVVPAAFVVSLAFLLVVAALHRLGAVGRDGAMVAAVAGLLYLPLLGSTSLVDPWESHYAEVAREMIARADWISPWWAQERWFFSKPVLDLWLEALCMRALGVHAEAGAMLAPLGGVSPRPEWALRLPAFLSAILGLVSLRAGVARAFGRRAGLLAAVVLATMPQFFLMARQATTDMPLVGALAAALGLLLTAASAERGEEAPSCVLRIRGRELHLRAVHLVLGAAMLLVVPQILYLVSRNVGPGLTFHADVFRSGSPGNCDVPGNAPCAPQAPFAPGFPPALQALVWTAILGLVVVSHRAERRLDRVAYLGAFLFVALATMAKGPVGLALPGAAWLAALAVSGRLGRLARMPLAGGAALVLAAVLPWYVAAFSRHGSAFTDELVFRHMIGRATSHLHDTNIGDDVSFRYYVWQLGYAMFGWAGLAPAALARWPSGETGGRGGQRFARVLCFLWVALAFGLFTAMPTKFHHYIFPALPPAAVLIGLLLDELGASRARPGALAGAVLGGAVLVLLITRDLAAPGVAGEARLINLVTYNYQRAWPETVSVRGVITGAGLVFAGLLCALAVPRLRRWATIALAGAALAFAAWGLDGYLVRVAPHWGQRELVEAYHRARSSEADPIAAFNVNWKGENLYTGNRVAVFPAGGRVLTWIDGRRQAGARAIFFLVEHGRVPALRKEVGEPRRFELLTGPAEHNKFVLVKITYE